MTLTDHILPVLILVLLCAGWVAVQLLARKMGTKNHIDNASSCCGKCNGGVCDLKSAEES